MSTANPLPRSIRSSYYTATAGQTVFGPPTWLAFDPLDIEVATRMSPTAPWLPVTAGVAITLSASPAGVPRATFAAGLAAGTLVRLRGRRTHERSTDVTRAGSIVTAAVERELDKMTTVLQELRRDVDAAEDAFESVGVDVLAARDQAVAAAAAAVAAPAVVQVYTTLPTYLTRALAAAATIGAGVNFIRVLGDAAAADGGMASYRYVVTDPGTPGAAFQDVSGKWWSLVPEAEVNARIFGARFDGVTDDTVALQRWLNYLSARKLKGVMPPGTAMIGTVFLPSDIDIRGAGWATVLKVKNGHNATALLNSGYYAPLSTGGGNTNIRLRDFAIDSNGAGQTSALYPLALVNVQNVEMRGLRLYNPTGTLLYLSENDVFGSGPGGHPAIPGAQQFNYNVTIEDCVFDGSAQLAGYANADLNVVCRVQGLWMARNTFIGGGANCISLQMNREFHFCENIVRDFFRGIFAESCVFGEISRNDLFSLGTIAPSIGDATYSAIWLASANESYPGAGYNASSDILVHGNHIHDLTRGGGTTGLIAIRVSGPYGPTGAYRNRISDNIVSRFAASGSQERAGIVLEGWCEDCVVDGNIVTGQGDGAEHGIVMGRGGYGGADDIRNCAALNNRVKSCYVGVWQQNVGGHLGTMIVGNQLRACVNPLAVAAPGQAGYLAANNAT